MPISPSRAPGALPGTSARGGSATRSGSRPAGRSLSHNVGGGSRGGRAVGDRTLEVAVGSSNEADVGLERHRPAGPLVPPFLQDAKELGLHGRRELADLVEEERPARRQLEAPGLPAVGAREGAALVTEEPGLCQRLWQHRAVERDEGAVGARAGVMDRPGQDFLPGAALTSRGAPWWRWPRPSATPRAARTSGRWRRPRSAAPTVDGPLRLANHRASGVNFVAVPAAVLAPSTLNWSPARTPRCLETRR
jgi:hypothetical protein